MAQQKLDPTGNESMHRTIAKIAAGSDGLSAGTLQATLQALASRIAAVEA